MKFLDTETCGLCGPAVLIQYADGLDGETKLHSVWNEPVGTTLEIIDSFLQDPEGVIGFNLAFDWFQICKLYTTLALFPDYDMVPVEHIGLYAELEPQARFGPCIKPVKAFDIMLHARKGPYQSTMNRDDIRIKKVPTPLAWQLAKELEKRIPLKDIYFARKSNVGQRWNVYDIETKDGRIDPTFKDVVLKFAPSSALKALAVDALEIQQDAILLFSDVGVPKSSFPNELGYAPFALAVGKPGEWNGAWPEHIRVHISHWTWNDLARQYAALDVIYLQRLYKHFGCPELDDDDSVLACAIGAIRWRGYAINKEGIQEMKAIAANKNKEFVSEVEAKNIPFINRTSDGRPYTKIPTSPQAARKYITAVMSEDEKYILEDSTKKTILEEIATSEKWRVPCDNCNGTGVDPNGPCLKCKNGFVPHPASIRSQKVLDARKGQYEVDFWDKILRAGRFHASFAPLGALSSRMSGSGAARGVEMGGRAKGDGLNAQGVKRTKEARGQFPLADRGLILCGGDFSGFEVTLAEAVYGDEKLREDLLKKRTCHMCNGSKIIGAHECKGKKCKLCTNDGENTCAECKGKGIVGTKIHALFGMSLFPGKTYEEICRSAGTNDDMYEKAKRCFFATLYGGEAKTMHDRVGIPIEVAEEAILMFGKRYPKVGEYNRSIYDRFCSMRQPGGIGSRVEWHEPDECAYSLLGFPRYFTLENQICRVLFDLASDPPESWRGIQLKVVRRDRLQTASGALQSALFAAAFNIQSFNMRAAKNHEIQSSGAGITKMVQRRIWDLQPPGVNPWLVQPMNVHDEIQCPTHPSMIDQVATTVKEVVESVRPKVPLIKMDWQSNLNSWADKS